MSPLADSLLRWYRRHRRSLPWRAPRGGGKRPDPYRIWVSEVMLQQTQVRTVLPYFERFVERFPDVGTLAAASEQEVLAVWSGLGYYRRAKALHRAAQIVVEELGGELPSDVEGWLRLPGVGRYTAGAVVSIGFGKRAPILDGNVARVLSRLFVVRGDPRQGEAHRELWRLAEEILPRRSVGDFNQALMELGALVCTSKSPRCLVCPVRTECGAFRRSLQQELPEARPRPPSVAVNLVAAVVEEQGKLLLYRRRDPKLMQDLWELPGGECRAGEGPRATVAREARERYGLRLEPGEELARVKHTIMNRRITLHAFSATLASRPVESTGAEHRWVDRGAIDSVPVSSMVQKILKASSREPGNAS